MNAPRQLRPGLGVMCWAGGTLLLVAASGASIAQQVYKCKNADGSHSYQATPCPESSSTINVRAYTPVPNSPTPIRRIPVRTDAAVAQPAYAPVYSGGGPSRQTVAEQRKLLSDIDAQIRQVGQLNSRGEREMVADLMRLRGQLVSGSAVTGPQSRTDPTTARAVRASTPTRVTDQYGRTYEQPPGSTFVTDTQTGKMCFKNGDFIHCD